MRTNGERILGGFTVTGWERCLSMLTGYARCCSVLARWERSESGVKPLCGESKVAQPYNITDMYCRI